MKWFHSVSTEEVNLITTLCIITHLPIFINCMFMFQTNLWKNPFTLLLVDECVDGQLIGTDEGFGPRNKHDTQKRWMVVDQRFPFPGPGHVDYVEFWAGSDSDRPWSNDRGLKVGYFKSYFKSPSHSIGIKYSIC